MIIEPISTELSATVLQPALSARSVVPNDVFDQLLAQVNGINDRLISNEQSVQKLVQGDTENLHQVVLGLEQTRLAFDLMLQVRNKVLDAYQEIMRMQL